MAALTGDKDRRRFGRPIQLNVGGVGTGVTIYAGAFVGVNAAGYIVPFTAATGLTPRGVAQKQVVNAGANGAEKCGAEEGDFEAENGTAGDALTVAEIGDTVYALDDNTAVKTDGTGTRSALGKLVTFSATGKPVIRVTSPIL